MKVGLKNKVIKHIMKVNKWNKKETLDYIGYSFQEHKIKSKIKWKINLSILNEKYGVDKKLLNENLIRKPKIKSKKMTYKKKRKSSKKKMMPKKIK